MQIRKFPKCSPKTLTPRAFRQPIAFPVPKHVAILQANVVFPWSPTHQQRADSSQEPAESSCPKCSLKVQLHRSNLQRQVVCSWSHQGDFGSPGPCCRAVSHLPSSWAHQARSACCKAQPRVPRAKPLLPPCLGGGD